MTPEQIREMVNTIRELVDSDGPAVNKREAIEVEASDQDMLAIHEFCSWFLVEEPEGIEEGSSS